MLELCFLRINIARHIQDIQNGVFFILWTHLACSQIKVNSPRMDCQEIHKIKFLFINASVLWNQIVLEE